jgi:hypothetical protein
MCHEYDESALMRLMDHLKLLMELVSGYRKTAVNGGFSETMAELMAVELHANLMRVAFASQPPTPPADDDLTHRHESVH